jgi:hypothetical protein
MAAVPVETNRGRFSGVARPAGLDRAKYVLWDAGERLPRNEWEPGKPCITVMKCPCGAIFNSHCLEENLIHVPHIGAVAAPRILYSVTNHILRVSNVQQRQQCSEACSSPSHFDQSLSFRMTDPCGPVPRLPFKLGVTLNC